MAEVTISEAEKIFILHGVQDDLRVDGRARLDYRPIMMETGVVTHAAGSARLRLANSDILVGVKAELDSPLPGRPKEGHIEFFVDCSANATPEFEGRGGENLANEISQFLKRTYRTSETLDLTALCILEGSRCWMLHIDILILECGGNLFDAVSLAVRSALYTTQIPKVTVSAVDGGEPELELSDDPFDTFRLNAENLPCLVTLSKIGNYCVVDPTPEEEACSAVSVILAVRGDGLISSVRQRGPGSFHPETLNATFKAGTQIGKVLCRALQSKLLEEEQNANRKKLGFLAS